MPLIWNVCYLNPRLLTLTLILILVAGFSALQVLPRAEDPEIGERAGSVFTYFPGATAERVEALVSEPIEKELRQIEEVKLLVSTSRAGISSVFVELADETTDFKEVWSRVRDRLADLGPQMPEGASEPEFVDYKNAAYTLILGLTWELPGPVNRAILGRLAEELADELRQISGTESSKLFGEPEEEILVEVDPERLAGYGLSPVDVSSAIARADPKVAAGQLHGRQSELVFEVSGELDSLDRIRSLPIHAGEEGRFLRLADIGVVSKWFVDPPQALALIAGRPGVAVAARTQEGLRVDLWAARARKQVGAFQRRLPRGVVLTTLFDQSRYTQERLLSLCRNFLYAALLVMAVILFTMGWRSAILVGSALPLTTLMVLQGMRLLGIPIHQMSVTGLIIALGLLIDNAIVIVDEVRHRLEEGKPPAQAIAEATRGLAVPLGGSTITTVLAFMPIVLMPGPAGEFVYTIAMSVVLAVVSSFILALTVVPALTGFLDRTHKGNHRGLLQAGFQSRRLGAWYSRSLGFLQARPILSLGVAVLLPLSGYMVFPQLEEQFFPPADRDQFQLELKLPWQTSIRETEATAKAVRKLLIEHEAVEEVHWFIGESAPKFYYNLIESRRNVSFYAQALVQLHRAEGSVVAVGELQDQLDEAFPEAQILARQIEQGPPFAAPVEIRLYGPDLDVLRAEGEGLRAELAALPHVTHTRATLEGGQPKLLLQLDEEEARLAGLDNRSVARYLQASLEGSTGGSLLESTEELPVRVRLRGEKRASLDTIATLDLANDDGWTTLAALGELRLEPELAAIRHRNGRRINTVQAFLEAGTLPSAVLDPLRQRLEAEGFTLPAGYSLEYGGEAAERDAAVNNLAATVGVLLVLMAASLVLSFNSFRMACIIGGVGTLSIGLPLLALWVFRYPFGFMAIVGTMGLIGVAVNDSIVVLAALRRDKEARAGNREAVLRITLRQTRHLFSTTLTTMAGFTPLLLSGSGFWPPVAVAIGGGVAGATLLAVTFVPSMFLLLSGTRRLRARDVSVATYANP